MWIKSNIPAFYEIEEINKYLNSLPTKERKLDYLKLLYEEYIYIAYNSSDTILKLYLRMESIDTKYPPIPYIEDIDVYQTHISRSKYIIFLKKIDEVLLPFVRNEIRKYDKSFTEDESKIIKDYPVFDFNTDEIIKFSHTLKKDKFSYLEWIRLKRMYYFKEVLYPKLRRAKVDEKIKRDELYQELTRMMITMKRHPESEKEIIMKNNNSPTDRKSELYWDENGFCEFSLNAIKENAKKEENTKSAVIYLLRIKKEAMQLKNLMAKSDYNKSFFSQLDIEISFYKEKQKIENEAISIQPSDETSVSEPQKEPIRLHWQSDDVLIPYLMKSMFDEGFINNADFDARKDFIEQSFYKKSGKIFTAKEVSSVESNYDLNTDNKPRKAFKVERVINNMKAKRDEISKKKTSRAKKK